MDANVALAVGRVLALEDTVDVARRTSYWSTIIGPGDQAAQHDHVPGSRTRTKRSASIRRFRTCGDGALDFGRSLESIVVAKLVCTSFPSHLATAVSGTRNQAT